jgi:hypothetical protein
MENSRQGVEGGRGVRNQGGGGGGGRNFGYNNNYRGRGFGGGGYRGRGGYNNTGGGGRITDLTEAELRARLEKIQMQKEQEERKLAAAAKEKQAGESSSSAGIGDGAGKGRELINKGECFTCGKSGHVEAACPSKLEQLGLHLCAYGIPGQMFHSIHVVLDEGEKVQEQVSGVMTILEGDATEEKVAKEMCALWESEAVWTVKELEPGSFLVVFPNKEARKSLTRFKKGFYFVTEEIKAIVVDSQQDADAFQTLQEVWVRAFGIPQWAKKERVARQLAFLVGDPLFVDKSSLLKPYWVRIRVACCDPRMIGGSNNVFINGQGYRIRWEVEGDFGVGAVPPEPPMGSKSKGDSNNKEGKGKGGDLGDEGKDLEDEGTEVLGGADGGARDDLEEDLGDDDGDELDLSSQEMPVYGVTGNAGVVLARTGMTEEMAWPIITKSVMDHYVVTLPDEDGTEGNSEVATQHVIDEENEWTVVECRSAGKRESKRKLPAVATRTSKRVQRDGVPVQKKAEARALLKNDLTGNSFSVLHLVPKEKLSSIAASTKIVLGVDLDSIDNRIESLLAKEQAEAILACNREKVREEREKRRAEAIEPDLIGLANFIEVNLEMVERVVNVDQDDDNVLASPLADFENQVSKEMRRKNKGKNIPIKAGDKAPVKRGRGRPRKNPS